MTPKVVPMEEINGLRDLTPEQREDIDALCDEGLMPSQIARRLGVPTRVISDARRSWRRQKELDERADAPPPPLPMGSMSEPLAAMMAVTQQQLQQTLLQAQIDAMLEQNRHRKEANKLEERERAFELREKEAQFRDEYPPAEVVNETPQLDEYDFENNPFGAVMKFANDLKNKNATQNAIGSPQTNAPPKTDKPLTDADIAAFVATQPPAVIGKALAAVGTPYQSELEAVLIKNGVAASDVPRVIAWLKAEKARRAGAKA